MVNPSFEEVFRDFIRNFGGRVVPEGDEESADFFLPQDDIVAELKILQLDARLEHDNKLHGLVDDWTRRGLIVVFGRTVISLQKLNPICQREWLHILQPPVERVIRKANRQIRSTKQSLNCPSAKGLLLIANDGNLLYTNPTDYMILVSLALAKKTTTGERQYPHIFCVVYFSYRIASRDEGMPFWISGDVEPKGSSSMHAILERLRLGWLSYIERSTGIQVKEILKSIE
jgi:hypothetical protein